MARVCVIGCGTAGVYAAKSALENNMEVIVYEQSGQIGGLWNFSPQIGKDEFGVDSSGYMYKDLKTNVPKEIMTFPGLDYNVKDKWFLESHEIAEYLQEYAEKFKVKDVTKFRHHVVRVSPTRDQRWEVIVRNLKEDLYEIDIFDFVMVCNGHYSKEYLPHFKGKQEFNGLQIHSKQFKDKNDYKGQTVLVIGSSASAVDILHHLSETCKKVVIGHHLAALSPSIEKSFPENVDSRLDVKEITKTGAIFMDDSSVEGIDTIIYCTGFNYSFPFLSVDCGITVDQNYVSPLYKHVINIKHPTMAFIGLNYFLLLQDMIRIQCDFCLKFWTGGKELPSSEEMTLDMQMDLQKRLDMGWAKRHGHKMYKLQKEYFDSLCEIADIANVPKVKLDIDKFSLQQIVLNSRNFRNYKYEILNDEEFAWSEVDNIKKE